jgi:outer membrane protein OmpA-like peptidoglycan-associated protein
VEELANQATITARHAIQIATVVRDKPKLEDLILEWETYMARIQAAAGIDIPLDIKADVATDELETTVISLREKELQLRLDLADSQAFVAALEDEIRELDEQLGGASAERHQLVLQLENQARVEEQLAQTEALFLPSEAIVFRQSNTIVVRLFGLEFASGSAKLDENHTALLAKIEQAIGIYPDSSLKIEGHTDSQGSSRLNQRLSQNRAEAVLNYIVTTMHITSQRISAAGYGASQPIANNETKEGRAKNRRIDLLITPAG